MLYYLIDASAIFCSLTCLYLLHSWRRSRSRLPLPPGPKGLPLIGNVLDMPEAEEWEAARKWGEKYGPVVYVENFGTSYVFLNSYQSAVDLLEKRSFNYSSRPKNVMLDLEGWSEWFPVVMPYGDELKRSRRFLHGYLQPSSVGDYNELQTQSTHRMLEGLLRTPDKYPELVRHAAGETILMMAYGYKVAEKDDPFVALGEKGMSAFCEAEGFFLVNAFPWLRYLPAWFHGTGFLKIAKEGYKNSMAMYQEPHKLAKEKFLDGTAIPSLSSKLLEANLTNGGVINDEALISKTTGVAYAGGADTTVSSMLTFFLAMLLHPDVQRRAQEELDRVVGNNNLPSFDDRSNLPYIEAICKETSRWQVVGPLGKSFSPFILQTFYLWKHAGVARLATEDDEYNGYFIPAGATVLPNVWAMARDPTEYSEPDKFLPERWLPIEGKEPPLDIHKFAFGFGRRICPGRHFADNSVFIGIASVLSAFNISKALDENGEPITPEIDYTPHFIRHPKPFKYVLTPRSDKIANLVQQAVESAK